MLLLLLLLVLLLVLLRMLLLLLLVVLVPLGSATATIHLTEKPRLLLSDPAAPLTALPLSCCCSTGTIKRLPITSADFLMLAWLLLVVGLLSLNYWYHWVQFAVPCQGRKGTQPSC
jgi:hypothetical protein